MRINRIHIISYSVIIALILTLTLVTAACGTTAKPAAASGSATLQSIGLSCPPNVVVGSTQAITAMGTYGDGSTSDISSVATWTSSNTKVATISGGVLTAVAVGTTTITASISGITSPSTTLTIVSK